MADDDKPFACPEMGCGMQFTNEDHLEVHMRKHDMSLALNLSGTGMLSPSFGAFTDQTPTPTKFLKNLEEMGLFQELTKNPFDDSFKKAMDDGLEQNAMVQISLPITDTPELDTPQPQLPRIVIGDEDSGLKGADKAKDTLSSIVPKKRKKFLRQHSMPTSTTSEDESESVIGSSSSVDVGPSSLETEGGATGDVVLEAPPSSAQEQVTSTQTVSANPTEALNIPSTVPVVDTSAMAEPQTSKTQLQALVQVLLQLPNGQTIPVQVPASNIASPRQQALSSQPVIQNSAPAPKSQITQTLPQNVSSLIVQGSQPVVQNVVQNVQGTILTPQQAIVKQNPQSSIPLTVRPIQLGTGQVVGNQAANEKPGNFKTIMIQQNPGLPNTGIQFGQNVVTVSPPRVTLSQTKLQSGSQSYTKQRLKEALQQQNSQKISQLIQAHEIKQEHREQDNHSVVSSSGSVSSPEERPYSLLLGTHTPDSMESESKRKKFLERNRAAAARCRQKRKYWISNLEKKADDLTSQNTKLCDEVKSLRKEVAQLKTLLIAHKDCPVTMQQRSQGHITAETLKEDHHQKSEETAVVHILEETSEPVSISTSLPSVILTESPEKSSAISNTNSVVPKVISVSNIPMTNNMTLPNIISVERQMNGSASAASAVSAASATVNQFVIPSFVTVNQPTVQENQKTFSVITGPNSIGLIPKLINLDQLVQGNTNQPS